MSQQGCSVWLSQIPKVSLFEEIDDLLGNDTYPPENFKHKPASLPALPG